jgi:protein tyrosine phosphatase
MEKRIKLTPFTSLDADQFKEWVESIGLEAAALEPFFADEFGRGLEGRKLSTGKYHTGAHNLLKEVNEFRADVSEDPWDADEADKFVLEMRRYLRKTPATRSATRQDDLESEYMALLSEHWENRIDQNILKNEFEELQKKDARDTKRLVEADGRWHARAECQGNVRGAGACPLQERCGRDRYPGMVNAPGSRVGLSGGAYINANYIRYPDYYLRRVRKREGREGEKPSRMRFAQHGDVIATQGPLDGSEDKITGKKDSRWGNAPEGKRPNSWRFQDTRPQFWQMVMETGCDAIFNLTQLKEQGVIKCSQYWPSCPGEEETYGDITVKWVEDDHAGQPPQFQEGSEGKGEDGGRGDRSGSGQTKWCGFDRGQFVGKDGVAWLTTRTFELAQSGGSGGKAGTATDAAAQTRRVTQYHVVNWTDDTALDATEFFEFLHYLVEKLDVHIRNMHVGPPVVHCSAGVGRTGVLIALHMMMEQIIDMRDDFATRLELLELADTISATLKKEKDKAKKKDKNAFQKRLTKLETLWQPLWKKSVSDARVSVRPGASVWLGTVRPSSNGHSATDGKPRRRMHKIDPETWDVLGVGDEVKMRCNVVPSRVGGQDTYEVECIWSDHDESCTCENQNTKRVCEKCKSPRQQLNAPADVVRELSTRAGSLDTEQEESYWTNGKNRAMITEDNCDGTFKVVLYGATYHVDRNDIQIANPDDRKSHGEGRMPETTRSWLVFGALMQNASTQQASIDNLNMEVDGETKQSEGGNETERKAGPRRGSTLSIATIRRRDSHQQRKLTAQVASNHCEEGTDDAKQTAMFASHEWRCPLYWLVRGMRFHRSEFVKTQGQYESIFDFMVWWLQQLGGVTEILDLCGDVRETDRVQRPVQPTQMDIDLADVWRAIQVRAYTRIKCVHKHDGLLFCWGAAIYHIPEDLLL